MRLGIVSSQRRFLLVAAPVLAAVCILAFGARAEGNPSCAKMAEKAGCKLPIGAQYSGTSKYRSAEGTLSASVSGKGISVSVYDAYIKCKKYSPSNGPEAGLAFNVAGGPRPKVGKTYTVKETESRSGEESGNVSTTTEATVNFKTAKVASLTIHQVSYIEGELSCDGSGTFNLKRQQ